MIDYRADGGRATILLNRPERLNALTLEMARALIVALDRADRDPDDRTVIVTGAGRAFCAGADLADEAPAAAPGTDEAVQRDYGGLFTLRLFEMNKPVIATVNGASVGVRGTMQLAMDVRIAAKGSRFGLCSRAAGWFQRQPREHRGSRDGAALVHVRQDGRERRGAVIGADHCRRRARRVARYRGRRGARVHRWAGAGRSR